MKFHKTWQRILAITRAPIDMVFLFYLKAFNSNIVVMIWSLKENSLPQFYEMAIQVENSLIDAGKLPLRPSMQVFPKFPSRMVGDS